jgi:MoaA/NifB/PqqE/SkfB family radical SAM enzyme
LQIFRILELLDNTNNFIVPHEITIAGDKTCNLSCPSCRTGIVKIDDETTEYFQGLGKQLKDNIFFQPSNDRIRIHTSTSGEVFASPLLQSFIQSIPLEDYPNLELCLQSNGLLAPSRWDRLGTMADRVTSMIVTVDAARAETYEILRRGGKWEDIQSALEWLKEKKKQNGMKLNIRMVVQRANYSEMIEFYDMCKKFDADRVEYARIANWHTYEIGTGQDLFFYHDVFNPAHPDYSKAHIILDKVKKLPGVFLYGGL